MKKTIVALGLIISTAALADIPLNLCLKMCKYDSECIKQCLHMDPVTVLTDIVDNTPDLPVLEDDGAAGNATGPDDVGSEFGGGYDGGDYGGSSGSYEDYTGPVYY